MDEHSQEYISFMCSDEAACLHKQWQRRGVHKGDWVWDAGTEAGKVRLVTSVTSTESSAGVSFIIDGWAKRWTAEVTWLPSLFQLIRIIEGAGGDYTLTKSGASYCLESHAERRAIEGTDIMLKFARLAARAVEAQHETTTT